jgi:hypothetical protein
MKIAHSINRGCGWATNPTLLHVSIGDAEFKYPKPPLDPNSRGATGDVSLVTGDGTRDSELFTYIGSGRSSGGVPIVSFTLAAHPRTGFWVYLKGTDDQETAELEQVASDLRNGFHTKVWDFVNRHLTPEILTAIEEH